MGFRGLVLVSTSVILINVSGIQKMNAEKDKMRDNYFLQFSESYDYEYGTVSSSIEVLNLVNTISPNSEDIPVTDNTNYNVVTILEQKPLSVYFRKRWKEYVQSVNGQEITDRLVSNSDLPWESKMCDDWDELSEVFKSKPHQVIFHVSMLELNGTTVHEFVSMIKTLKKVVLGYVIPIAISIEKDTPLSLIKEFQKSEIHGIVPSVSSFGIDETYKGVEALFNRIPYWPKHILDQLPGAKKTVTKNTITVTPRQAQIVDLIMERGLSNKKIAQALNITESTVKIHVSAILKAYGVRTRTQLVVMSNK